VVTAVLPYVNALVIALRRMVDTFATAVGFELPDYSDSSIYTDITGNIDGVGDSAEKSAESVNKLKKAIAKFDELNVLTQGKTKGINTDTGSGYKELDDAINKKTTSYMQKFNQELANMQNKAEELANKIQPKLENFVTWLDKIAPILEGIGIAFITYKVVTWFNNLSTALAAFNPTTGVIALAVGAIAAIYLAVKKYNKKLVEEDLASRFGDITLSLEEIEEIAERLTTNEYTAKIDIYITEKQKLSEIESSIQKDINTLNKLNWKISIGLGLTEGEAEQYKSTIEKFISDSEAYIDQQHYVATLAVNAVIQDKDFKGEVQLLVDEYFNGSKGEMARLGKQLQSAMIDAMASKFKDEEKNKLVNSIISEMNDVYDRIASAEFKAKLQMITVDGDITPKSFKDLTTKVQDIIQERTKQAEEASYTVLASINARYAVEMENATTPAQRAEIQREWDKTVNGITDELSKTKSVVTFEGMEFAYDTLRNNYKEGFDGARDTLGKELKNWLSKDWYDQYINSPAENTVSGMVSDVQLMVREAMSYSGLNKAARTGLDQILDGLEPTREDLKKIYDEALQSGSQVTDGINDQLTDDMTLRALSDNMDGIWFLMGQKLSTDPVFLKALSQAEDAGKWLNEDIIRGLKSGIPDLRQQGSDLIFNLDEAIEKTTKEKAKDANGYAETYIGKYGNAFAKDKTTETAVKKWLSGIDDIVKKHKLPSMTQMIELKLDSAGLKSTGIDIMDLQYSKHINGYAEGGHPNTGELFLSRENGMTEYVGRMGGKTTVANNDDISAGIEEASYRGMTRALFEADGKGNVNVNVTLKGDAKGLFEIIQEKAEEYHDITKESPFPI